MSEVRSNYTTEANFHFPQGIVFYSTIAKYKNLAFVKIEVEPEMKQTLMQGNPSKSAVRNFKIVMRS